MQAVNLRHIFRRLAVDCRVNFRTGYSKFPACSKRRSIPVLNPAYRKLSSIPACLWPSDLPRATEWGYGTPGKFSFEMVI